MAAEALVAAALAVVVRADAGSSRVGFIALLLML